MKKKLLIALIAGTGLLSSAFAVGTTVTGSAGDLLIGFYATGGQGNDTSVVIDAGSFHSFIGGGGATVSITGFSTSDLVSTYGATWYDRTDLVWGVIGSTSKTAGLDSVANSYGFKASKSTLFATTLTTAGNLTAQGNGAGAILGIYGTNSVSTVGSSSNVFITTTASSTGSSFINQKGSGADFLYFAAGSIGVNNLPGVAGTATQDLYEYIPTGVSGTTSGAYNLGTFSLTSSGLSFTSVGAIPEPSTYAAIFGVAMLGFAAYRRRFQKKN